MHQFINEKSNNNETAEGKRPLLFFIHLFSSFFYRRDAVQRINFYQKTLAISRASPYNR